MAISFLAPSQRSRIAIIDILRGFALYGIILAHAGAVYLLEMDLESHELNSIDRTIKSLLIQFIEKKFYLIFSFLFGLSFFIQLDNATTKNNPFILKYIWRLFILFLIGFLHNQLYPFDILQIYAVIGLFLLPLRNLRASQLLYIAFILFLYSIFSFYNSQSVEPAISLWLQGRIHLSKRLIHQLASGNFFSILSLFILGFWAGKTKKFQSSSIDTSFFKRLFLISLLCILVIKTIFYFTNKHSLRALFHGSMPFNISLLNLCISMMYTSFICLSHYYLRHMKPLWYAFENIGRMGLTNYIAQTLFFFILFRTDIDFSRGGLVLLLASVHLFFFIQIFYSTIWFRYFKMGPIECLWRITTNLKWQSNKQSSSKSSLKPSPTKPEEVVLTDPPH